MSQHICGGPRTNPILHDKIKQTNRATTTKILHLHLKFFMYVTEF